VNRAHLRAFVWLRWRLGMNQMRRSGPGGAAVAAIVTALMVAGGAIALLGGFIIGFGPLRTASPRAVMVIWDAAIVGFLLFWMIGLITELQRSDALSFDRFLHLPVSPSSAFFINYLGSSVSLSLIVFLPAMLGLAAGLALSRGVGMLALFPLVIAFFLMMTAVTHQFRGWLASMMENPRRRRSILAIVPILFIVAVQLPAVLTNFGPGARERRAAREENRRSIAALDEELAAGRMTKEEYDARRPAPPPRNPDAGYGAARLVNVVAPPGWLAYGAEAAAERRPWPPLAGVVGMGLIGVLSLRRSYRTTIRLYRGEFDRSRRQTRTVASAVPAVRRSGRANGAAALLERRLPWTSERVAAVATASFRSWMRASEMKMMLMTPVFILVVFTGMFSGQSSSTHELLRPLNAAGLAALLLILGMVGPVGNQFAYDRAAFRTYVLGPLPRRDVLFGKNLALLPFALPMMVVAIALSQWFRPMRMDYLAAALIQTIPMYLVFCIGANLLSILAPITLKPGSGMPAPHQGIRHLYHILFMLLVSLLVGVTFIPLGVEALLGLIGNRGLPAYLVLGLLQAPVAVWVYRAALDWQGELLQRREQQILEIVAARAE
jgi:hypothetical protein